MPRTARKPPSTPAASPALPTPETRPALPAADAGDHPAPDGPPPEHLEILLRAAAEVAGPRSRRAYVEPLPGGSASGRTAPAATPRHTPQRPSASALPGVPMNLRVTIEGKVYDLLIETSDEQTAPSSAAMPPLRLGRPASPSSQAVSTAEAAIAAKAARAKAAATEAQAAVLRVRWGAENPDEVPTPISGTVTDILVKIGDTLHINDAVAVVTADSMLAAGSRPFVGTVRSLVGGTVADVLVRPGDRVGLHQSLVRVARKP